MTTHEKALSEALKKLLAGCESYLAANGHTLRISGMLAGTAALAALEAAPSLKSAEMTDISRGLSGKPSAFDVVSNFDVEISHPYPTYLMVGSGETYSARIVPGNELLDALLGELFSNPAEADPTEKAFWEKQLADEDQWHHSQDFKRTHWSSDIGETDHISFYLITE